MFMDPPSYFFHKIICLKKVNYNLVESICKALLWDMLM